MGRRVEAKAYTLVRRGNKKRLRLLFRKHPELLGSDAAMLLFGALWHNRGMLRWLLERGVHPDCGHGHDDMGSPLMQAAFSGLVRELRMLLEFGADMTLLNESGEDAFGYAVTWEQPEAIRALVAHGFDVNDTTDSGPYRTQLDIAEQSGWQETARCLRELGGKHFSELTWEGEWREGDLIEVAQEGGPTIRARVLPFPTIVFLSPSGQNEDSSARNEDLALWVHPDAGRRKNWRLLEKESHDGVVGELPIPYRRDHPSGVFYLIHGEGDWRETTAEDCRGREKAVVLSAAAVEERLREFHRRRGHRHCEGQGDT